MLSNIARASSRYGRRGICCFSQCQDPGNPCVRPCRKKIHEGGAPSELFLRVFPNSPNPPPKKDPETSLVPYTQKVTDLTAQKPIAPQTGLTSTCPSDTSNKTKVAAARTITIYPS